MLCILQARMSSKRLPGKTLKKVGDKTLLEMVIDRVLKSKYVSKIIVATSNHISDLPIRTFCKKKKIKYFAGSLNNVSERFYKIIQSTKSKSFIRISGDSPLIDPSLIDIAAKKFNSSEYDIVTNIFPRTFPKGQSVEIIKSSIFKKYYFKMKQKYYLEHVTQFFYKNFKNFKIKNFSNKKDFSHIKMSIDTKTEFKWLERVYNHFTERELSFLGWKDIIKKKLC